MSTPLKQALIEAAWLMQAFIAALQALWVAGFFLPHGRIYFYVVSSIPPLFALIIMYIVFIQLRLSSPSKLLTLQLEAAKSGLVTVLWLWLFISDLIATTGLGLIICLVALIVPGILFYPTLVVAYLAWRRGRISL